MVRGTVETETLLGKSGVEVRGSVETLLGGGTLEILF